VSADAGRGLVLLLWGRQVSGNSPSLWRLLAAISMVAASVAPQQALAWGAEGHRIVAQLAYKQLSSRAQAEVVRLLSQEPGATLESISTWADEVRSPSTGPWHYVNFPRDGACDFDAAPLCIDGMCVVVAIERQGAVLASGATDDVKLKALKWLTHLVADVHQPLHAGYADDRGGNQYQVQAFGRGSNLHSVWDSGLIANWPGGSPVLLAAAEAETGVSAADRRGGGVGSSSGSGVASAVGKVGAARWAEESCRIVGSDGFYPDAHKLDDAYAPRWAPTLVHQLALAGRRLANVLNGSFGTPR
jgi:hypothetical protein